MKQKKGNSVIISYFDHLLAHLCPEWYNKWKNSINDRLIVCKWLSRRRVPELSFEGCSVVIKKSKHSLLMQSNNSIRFVL